MKIPVPALEPAPLPVPEPESAFQRLWEEEVVALNKRGMLIALVFVWFAMPASMIMEYMQAPPDSAPLMMLGRGIFLLLTLPMAGLYYAPNLFKKFNQVALFVLLTGLQLITTYVSLSWGGFESPYFAPFAFGMLISSMLFVWPVWLVGVLYPLFALTFVGANAAFGPSVEAAAAVNPSFFVISSAFFSVVLHFHRKRVLQERIQTVAQLEEVNQALELEREKLEIMSGELERMALVDALTRVGNRRAFDDVLPTAFEECKASRSPVSLIICDVDHFKPYNDTYGHQKGDTCLRRVASALQASMYRGTDFVARYGGDEFVVLLPGVDLDVATRVAERMRVEVASLAIPHSSSKCASTVTVSAGVASTELEEVRTFESLLKSADEGLYRAKKKGRDRIALSSDSSMLNHAL